MAEPYYTTPDQVRTAAGVDSSTLSDGQANALILDAEDVVDALLGAWPVNYQTGRKIRQAQVLSWQWDRLSRATAKVAAKLYENPKLLEGQRYQRVSGPDFSYAGPLGHVLGEHVVTILNQSQLRRLTTRATPRVGQTMVGSVFPVANGPSDPDLDDDGLSSVASSSDSEGWG
jgi:hypothetical protein